MAKKLNFGPDFGSCGSNLDPKIFFCKFYFYQLLDIVASYHCMQFQGKLIIKLKKMAKSLILGLIQVPWAQIQAANIFSKIWLCQPIDIMVSYRYVQYQKKINDPILRKFSDRLTDGQMDEQIDEETGGQG